MRSIIALPAFAFASVVSAGTPPTDYVKAGEQIKFNGSAYHLKWSDNPSANYFKQEYLKDGSTLDDYTEMITVDVLVGSIRAEQAIQIKVKELTARKKSDPVTNYAVYKNEDSGEIVLDFVICDGVKLLEWNLYRYVEVSKGSRKNLILIAYTNRGTLAEAKTFFNNLKGSRNDMILALNDVVLPNMGK